MQPGEKQLGEMQLGEMQHFNTTALGEMQPGEMQFGEMQLSLWCHAEDSNPALYSDLYRPNRLDQHGILKKIYVKILIIK